MYWGGVPLNDIVEVYNVGMKYQSPNGEITALENINFSVREGEFVSIVGPSGCGKSTLLSILSGLLSSTTGSVIISGEKVVGTSPKIGYMLQKDHLFDWRTIYQNVMLGLEIRKAVTPKSKERAIELLKTYGLFEFKDNYPSQLSGGMRQRVALIRTLVTDPQILLLDEAFSALDFQTRLVVNDDIYTIIKKENKTALLVTHDIAESISMTDRVVLLSKRPGTVKNGLETGKDVSIDTTMQFAAMPGAFLGGQGDYAIIFEPTASRMEKEGKAYIVASLGKDSGEIPYTAYFANRSTIENNPEMIQKFTNAVYKGQRWVDSHTPEEIGKAIKPQFPDENDEILVSAVKRYKDQNSWKKDPILTENDFYLLQQIMKEAGELNEIAPYEKVVTKEFGENVIKNN